MGAKLSVRGARARMRPGPVSGGAPCQASARSLRGPTEGSPGRHVLPFLQDGDELGEPVAFHLGGLPQSLELCYLRLPAFLFWGVREPGGQSGGSEVIRGVTRRLSYPCDGGRHCKDIRGSSEAAGEKEVNLVPPGSPPAPPQPTFPVPARVSRPHAVAPKPDPSRAKATSVPLSNQSLWGPGLSLAAIAVGFWGPGVP